MTSLTLSVDSTLFANFRKVAMTKGFTYNNNLDRSVFEHLMIAYITDFVDYKVAYCVLHKIPVPFNTMDYDPLEQVEWAL